MHVYAHHSSGLLTMLKMLHCGSRLPAGPAWAKISGQHPVRAILRQPQVLTCAEEAEPCARAFQVMQRHCKYVTPAHSQSVHHSAGVQRS